MASRSSSSDPPPPLSFLPHNNQGYGERSYWEDRFAVEEEYEWLLSYAQLAPQLAPYLSQRPPEQLRILVVGCGNAPFSADLYDAGYTRIVNWDYSEQVINAMQQRHTHRRPGMTWHVADLTDPQLVSWWRQQPQQEKNHHHEDEFHDDLSCCFDVILDKATMDALMTTEGDVWHPAPTVIDSARAMCRNLSDLLVAPGGTYLQISLTQPHFRIKYLLGLHHNPPPPLSSSTLDSFSVELDDETHVDDHQDQEEEAAAVDPLSHYFVKNHDDNDDHDDDDHHGPDSHLAGPITDPEIQCAKTTTPILREETTLFSSEFQWTLQVQPARSNGQAGCFGHFLYIMTKR